MNNEELITIFWRREILRFKKREKLTDTRQKKS